MAVVTDNQIVSLIDMRRGAQLYQWLPEDYTTLSWARRAHDASGCSLSVPPLPGVDRLGDVATWAHWLSVWDGDRDLLLWTGPVQKATGNRGGLALEAKDHAAYLTRTRNPTTKRWDAADPATIAAELWEAMLTQKAINSRPLSNVDPEGDRYDFQVITDDQMLDQTLGDLVNLGLRWTVVSGTPLIGPLTLEPVATLGENDFLGDGIDFVRDGTAVFNDVLVRGPDNLARAKVDYYDQVLQTIANVDSMFGVSNVTRAAQAYVKQTGAVRTKLDLPSGTQLHPDAPVSIDELVPGLRFVIEAEGIRQMMELTTVEIDRRAGAATVKVTMDSVDPKMELGRDKNAPKVTLGGEAVRT